MGMREPNMKSKHMMQMAFWILIAVIIAFIGYGIVSTKLTFKEYKSYGQEGNQWIEVASNGDSISQTFIMPYEILHSVAIKVGTYGRDNNSEWIFYLFEASTGKEVYQRKFNASLIEDQSYYEIEVDRNIKVNKGAEYIVVIQATDVSETNALAFRAEFDDNAQETSLYHGEELLSANLCFRVYGGDPDYWWCGLLGFLVLVFLVTILRVQIVVWHGKKPWEDRMLQILFVGILFFILQFSFSIRGAFNDELDNMRGGLVIANGGVLYRDYITQHTPVVYYLCSLFALLGANSISQFRLSYYILESVIWALVYARHADYFGKKKLLQLTVLEVICISSVMNPEGCMVLSDGWQGLLFVVLMLEFLRYYKDRSLGWDRSVIVSLCIWGSFGAIFISAYSLIWVVMAVILTEINEWSKTKCSAKDIFIRYYKLLISLVVPFGIALMYFKFNHALRSAFDQCYVFNREVYPQYIGGLGETLFQPFINGVQNFFIFMRDNFILIITAGASITIILRFIIMAVAVAILIKMFEKRKYMESITLFLFMIFSAIRGYEFHGLAAWYLAVMIIALNIDVIREMMPRLGMPALGLAVIILSSTYVVAVGENLLYEQPSISELENAVIELTADEENKDIFLDAYTYDSLYFFYKDRKPTNPAVYMLPWYMDWYEDDNIISIMEREPKIIVYNMLRECWGYKYFCSEFDKYVKENYVYLGNSDEGWKYSIWIKKE